MSIRSRPGAKRRQRGLSLIELVISIVIISVALAGIVGLMNLNAGHSADPLQRKQALAVAEALLEEVESVPFASINAYHNLSLTGGDSGNPTSANMPVGYTATVLVAQDAGFGEGASPLQSTDVLRITVTVTFGGSSLSLDGYRTNY